MEYLAFEQNYYSRTAKGFYENGHDSIRLMKWICYADRSFSENINCFDMMATVLTCLIEIS